MPVFEEPLPGVLVRRMSRHEDSRGWLIELFRDDELPNEFEPAMGYLSVTHPGVARGPHEHVEQTDGFAFLSGAFRLYLWENRSGAADKKVVMDVGENDPVFVTVPPGVVHAYKNIGSEDAFVLNFPDQLYAGINRAEAVDEIRHEDDLDSRFGMDD
jgi:dTDP-4-dehydrorhamnose 3,5-epimerase